LNVFACYQFFFFKSHSIGEFFRRFPIGRKRILDQKETNWIHKMVKNCEQ
jgi:hypothetical protein